MSADLFATITKDDSWHVTGSTLVFDKPPKNGVLLPMVPAPTTPAPARALNLNVLALDLATKCGWAYATRNGKQRSGMELFKPGRLDHNGQRWAQMRAWLSEVAREMGEIHVVYFEDVKRHVSNLSARVYFGYLAILEAWCAANNVRLVGVGVGTVKKAWTGFGNATKDDMIAEATRRGFKVVDDNHADALAILSYGVKREQ